MLWALPLAGAAIGAIQGSNQRKAQQDYNKSQAEIHRYSPWTGMQGKTQAVTASGFGGALQGGLTGAGMAQSFGGFGGGAAGAAGGASQMKEMATHNAPLFEAGKYGEMGGYMDTSTRKLPPGFALS